MVAQRLTQIAPPAATPDKRWQRVEAAWSAVPQKHSQSHFESLPRFSNCPRQTSSNEDHHIVRITRVQPTASSAAIQEQEPPSLGASVSSRTIRKRLAERHLGS
ncbi:hypothetical protein TNCV_3783181 [Trichonephila clavipes]|nr:hypothetical protein TNCV_3783181 [Trichonephila clavipes]